MITTAADSKYRCAAAPVDAVSNSATLKPNAALVPMATSKSMLPLPARNAPQPAR